MKRQVARVLSPVPPRLLPNAARRCGAFTPMVLVCLLVSSMILLSLLKMSLLHDRQQVREVLRVQAGWLAESGLARGAARLQADAAYSGETWSVPAPQVGGRSPAVVTITIETIENQPLQRRIVAVATYPAEGSDQARWTRKTNVTLIQDP